jgi:2-oxoglutarate/2-oxoacid ferredoxin oxidoreductase subunit alpha
VALDAVSIPLHEKELSDAGMIIYDSASLKEKHDKAHFLDVPFLDLAVGAGGDKVMANVVAIGAVLGMLEIGTELLHHVLGETIGRKGEEILRLNEKAALAGREFAATNCLRCSFVAAPHASPKITLGMSEAMGIGAICSGCKFYSAYPMTPSTGIMLYLTGKASEYGIVVEQAEDEIAAINMAIGASFAGVRSMTATAGGGFALMVEGLSLAAMTETPIVIALGQRPAPATGFPTRTEQADLLFSLYAGHGEFPRVVFAPGSPEQAIALTNKAFDLSQKYQIPAFILFDQYLADSLWTYGDINLDGLVYKDYRLRGEEFGSQAHYKRHAFTDTGVSPFGVPGDAPHVVVTDSDEHDEEGHIVEDAETRMRMVDKRLFKKLPLLRKEMNPPSLYGSEDAEVIVVGWGSTYGIIREAVDVLARDRNIAMLHFSEVFPFPENRDFLEPLRKARLTICVEQNGTSQFARLMKAETGYEFDAKINRYDGRPFLVEELIGELNGYIR